jgi:hypothetical protein
MNTALVLAALSLPGSMGLGQSSPVLPDRVEEDWQLVIASPNPDEVGPQITTCMSPVSDNSTPFAAFDLNYIDYPSFEAGGLQVKVYSGGNVTTSSTQGTSVMSTPNETITWTQRMHIVGSNSVRYSILNGQSTTWGSFGRNQGLAPVTLNASVTSLTAYSPATSVAASGVGWQSNRVSQMTLVQVRYYNSSQLLSTDTTSRSVALQK